MGAWEQRGNTWGALPSASRAEERVSFLKRVYMLFTGSVLFSAIGALFALHAGVSSSQATLSIGQAEKTLPPLVAFFGQHYIAGAIIMFLCVFGAYAVRHVRGLNVLALFGMATMIGIIVAPSVFVAQLAASAGNTLSSAPIRDAFILATLGFAALTGYAFTTKRDFSYLGGALTMGLFVLIGASILNLFFHSSVFGLAIASVSVLAFGGFVLYDTSKILHGTEEDPVSAAIELYLDFLNLFLALLRILSRRSD